MTRPLLHLVLLLSAEMACAPQPRPRPRPAPPNPVTTLPPIEAPTPETATRRFAYAPGEHHYLLTTEAMLTVRTDSTPPLSSQVRTRALYALIADTTGGTLRTQGSLDSLVIDRGPRVPAAAELPTLPLLWDSNAVPPTERECSVSEELIHTGREILLELPTNLPDGHHWRDSSTTQLCRAGIPVTISTVHEYRVVGPDTFQGDSALRISRASTATFAGTRTIGQHAVSLSGAGNTTAELYLDLAGGALLARTEQGHTELSIQTPRGTTYLTQELRAQLQRRQ